VKRISSCNNTTFFFNYFTFFRFCNATFFHFGYVIKPPQPSSAIYGAPPFTGNPSKLALLASNAMRSSVIKSSISKISNKSETRQINYQQVPGAVASKSKIALGYTYTKHRTTTIIGKEKGRNLNESHTNSFNFDNNSFNPINFDDITELASRLVAVPCIRGGRSQFFRLRLLSCSKFLI